MTSVSKKFIGIFVFVALAASVASAAETEAPAATLASPDTSDSSPPPPANLPPVFAASTTPDPYLAGIKRIVVWCNRSSMPTDIGIGPFTIDWDLLDTSVAKNLELLIKPAVRKKLVIQYGATAKAPPGITDKETLFISFNFNFRPTEYNEKKAFLEDIHFDLKLPDHPEMNNDADSGFYRHLGRLRAGYSIKFWPGPVTTGVLYGGTRATIERTADWFNAEYPLPETQEKNKDKQP